MPMLAGRSIINMWYDYADVMEYHQRIPREKAAHILTYEDQDGDWMMVGDVPWEYVSSPIKWFTCISFTFS